MIPMTTAQIRDAVAGVLHGDEALTVTGVSTDSRQISPGDWFVPILGERFDGHDYIDTALEAGAVGCFCARYWKEKSLKEMMGACNVVTSNAQNGPR